MTSASNPPPVLNADRIDATAERIATDWGHHGRDNHRARGGGAGGVQRGR
ncbi:hypothetical protein [Mycobacterium sp. MS1601]|jgi:hypothetical protein|nr:hypothetical protein [Mycobacterium sp. MS1601]